jgi:hypothetical protein
MNEYEIYLSKTKVSGTKTFVFDSGEIKVQKSIINYIFDTIKENVEVVLEDQQLDIDTLFKKWLKSGKYKIVNQLNQLCINIQWALNDDLVTIYELLFDSTIQRYSEIFMAFCNEN